MLRLIQVYMFASLGFSSWPRELNKSGDRDEVYGVVWRVPCVLDSGGMRLFTKSAINVLAAVFCRSQRGIYRYPLYTSRPGPPRGRRNPLDFDHVLLALWTNTSEPLSAASDRRFFNTKIALEKYPSVQLWNCHRPRCSNMTPSPCRWMLSL